MALQILFGGDVHEWPAHEIELAVFPLAFERRIQKTRKLIRDLCVRKWFWELVGCTVQVTTGRAPPKSHLKWNQRIRQKLTYLSEATKCTMKDCSLEWSQIVGS